MAAPTASNSAEPGIGGATVVRRGHRMPFGAEVRKDGVRFRLWAPAAREVALCIEEAGAPPPQAMTPTGNGWFRMEAPGVSAGTRYRFRIDGEIRVPDPASRFQPQDVHGPSQVIDPREWAWSDGGWRGRPWEEAIIYELHVGTFSPEGTFEGVERRLDHLRRLGVTAIELMPVADFPGARNWGYDGALPFAPDSRYGPPDRLKSLVQAAHARGLMVLLDVVYNHFGPEGNYLHRYAPGFFTSRHITPWGDAINLNGPDSHPVRRFFIHNALYWLHEYHFDGLRLDAVHAIRDESPLHFLEELADAVRAATPSGRHIHLVLENDDNGTRFLQREADGRPRWYAAQWNEDLHHALHVLATGEKEGYYQDYADDPLRHLARCLAEGFAYQGEPSRFRGGTPRGEPSGNLPPGAFVGFLQNHDQVGNRAFGERIGALAPDSAVRAITVIVLLAPFPPLLFMGQEWGARQPFPYFCDFEPELAEKVAEGRRRDCARFPGLRHPGRPRDIPDPGAEATFRLAALDWHEADRAVHRQWLALHRELLAIRRREIVPRLRGDVVPAGPCTRTSATGLVAPWRLGDGSRLTLAANLGNAPATGVPRPSGRLLFAGTPELAEPLRDASLPAWAAAWFLDAPQRGGKGSVP